LPLWDEGLRSMVTIWRPTACWRPTAWRVACRAGCCALVGLAFAVIAPIAVSAADLPAQSPAPASAPAAYAPAAPDWIITVGGELRIGPKWAGAPTDKFGLTGGPLFSIRKVGTPPEYFGPRDSFGFSVLDIGQFKIGPAIKLVWQRKASDDIALNGLGDINFALQVGAFAEYWPVQWLRLRGELRQGFDGERGVTGDLFADVVVPVGQFRFSGGPRLTAQSTAATSPYFSITSVQSAGSTVSGLPALPVYHAGGGIYSYGAGAQTEYFLNPQWATYSFTEYERLAGSAADSPLVIQRGSPNQVTFGLGARYSFTTHPWW
jgi:outer membrane protein